MGASAARINTVFTLGVWAATPYFFPQKNPGHDNPYTPGTLGYALTQLDN